MSCINSHCYHVGSLFIYETKALCAVKKGMYPVKKNLTNLLLHRPILQSKEYELEIFGINFANRLCRILNFTETKSLGFSMFLHITLWKCGPQSRSQFECQKSHFSCKVTDNNTIHQYYRKNLHPLLKIGRHWVLYNFQLYIQTTFHVSLSFN